MSSDDLICADCIEEEFLAEVAFRAGQDGDCDFCGECGSCLTLGVLADRVETAFEQHYERTSSEPGAYDCALLADKESDHWWEREGDPVVDAIESAARVPRSAAEAVQSILSDRHFDMELAKMCEELEFSSDSYYEQAAPNHHRWHAEWREFERSFAEETRFFSRSAVALLEKVFDRIEELRIRDGREVIIDAGPGAAYEGFYRARAFQSEDDLRRALARPDRTLGPPPAGDSRAGRMNAHGISVFYGSSDPKVALAEVRPPVGSKVAVALFQLVRPVRLLDLTALTLTVMHGSVFDPKSLSLFERIAFLRRLSDLIAKPVMPENETSEYLSTQAVADFLAQRGTPALDGVVFPSVQGAGPELNVVLFHKAARIEDMDVPEGTSIEVTQYQRWEDDYEPDYSVWETVPAEQPPKKQSPPPGIFGFEGITGAPLVAPRPVTLRLDLDSVRVHDVVGVQFQTHIHSVRRHRSAESDEPDPF